MVSGGKHSQKKLIAPLFSAQALLGVVLVFQHQLNKFM
jgi:hypothetical protein